MKSKWGNKYYGSFRALSQHIKMHPCYTLVVYECDTEMRMRNITVNLISVEVETLNFEWSIIRKEK